MTNHPDRLPINNSPERGMRLTVATSHASSTPHGSNAGPDDCGGGRAGRKPFDTARAATFHDAMIHQARAEIALTEQTAREIEAYTADRRAWFRRHALVQQKITFRTVAPCFSEPVFASEGE